MLCTYKKRIYIVILIIITIFMSLSPKRVSASQTTPYLISEGDGHTILQEAKQHIGKSYVWGANGSNTFDCSGFVTYIYNKLGLYDFTKVAGERPTTKTYTSYFQSIALDYSKNSYSSSKTGDIIIFYTANGEAGHMGVYVDNGRMINAVEPTVREQSISSFLALNPSYQFYRIYRVFGELSGFTIHTQDNTPEGSKLANMMYSITYPDQHQEQLVSDEEGNIHISNVSQGLYSFSQVSTIPGYKMNKDSHQIQLEIGHTTAATVLTITNEKITADTIKKKTLELEGLIKDFPVN